MAISLTITPGAVFSEGEPVTADKLNLMGTPVVTVPSNSIGADELDGPDVLAVFGDALRASNYLPWGTFYEERFLQTSLPCPAGLRTAVHPGWYVLPAGAASTASPSGRTSATLTTETGRTGLKVVGASALTSVEVGTWLPPGLTQVLKSGNLAFSLYVWNGTGQSFTPALKVYCAATLNDEGSAVLQSTVTGTACAAGAWTRQTFAIDGAGLTDFIKGALVALSVTKASGIMDSATDYVLVADAQIDKGVTTASDLKAVPPVLPEVPAGCIMPYAGTVAPPGWLLCHGTAVSRGRYAGLFSAIGTAYGTGDGATTFNLPDGRGRTLAGAEQAGASQGRLEVALTVSSSAGDLLTITAGSANGLRTGMGVYGNAFIPAGATIIAINETTIQLSAATTGSVTGTVRCSKLGGADAETLGAAGNGMAWERQQWSLTMAGCATTLSNTTLVVPSLTGMCCGMLVAGDGIPAGTTVAAFLTATTVRLSAAATASGTGKVMSFWVEAPDGSPGDHLRHLQQQPKMNCVISSTTDSNLQAVTGFNSLLRTGMTVSGPAGSGIVAGTYVSAVDANGTDFTISPATSGSTAGTYELTFNGSTKTRATPQTPDMLPAQLINWIIKY